MHDREFNDLIHGYLDGELDDTASREFLREIESSPERKARLETEEAFVGSVRGALAPTAVSDEYRNSIRSLIRTETGREERADAPEAVRRPILIRIVRSRTVQTVTAAAAALVFILVGHSLLTSSPNGTFLPRVIRDSVDLFDSTLRGSTELHAASPEDIAEKANYPAPPLVQGKFDWGDFVLEGFSDDGKTFEGARVPCFIFDDADDDDHDDVAFFCLGDRLRDDGYVDFLGKVFEHNGYTVLVCGVPGSIHVWVTELELDALLVIIKKDYGPCEPMQGIEIPVANLDCCGCADRALKTLMSVDGVADAHASVRNGRVYIQPAVDSDSDDLRKRAKAALVNRGFEPK